MSLYNNDEHYTNQVGANASLVFSGQGIGIGFLKGPYDGTAQISIDGSVVGTVNTYQSSNQVMRWDSGSLVNGSHTVVVSLVSGQQLELDYLEVTGPAPTATITPTPTNTSTPTITPTPTMTPTPTNTPALPGIGKYNDTDSHISYSGT